MRTRETPAPLPLDLIIIGIDNGVSGAVTVMGKHGQILRHVKMPIKNHLNYTKEKKWINRVDVCSLESLLSGYTGIGTRCYIERPMVNPQRFAATVSAVRALEATLIIFERLSISYEYIDSREWQKELLPAGLKGDELKRAADDVAGRMFPGMKIVNSDSILIAEYCRRKNTDGIRRGKK